MRLITLRDRKLLFKPLKGATSSPVLFWYVSPPHGGIPTQPKKTIQQYLNGSANKETYYMAKQSGKIRAFWLVLSWSGFCHTDRFHGNSHNVYFMFSKAGNFKNKHARVPYNKLLSNLACSSRTYEYWPEVVFLRTSLRSVCIATASGRYSPVRPSRSVSKK